MPRKTYGPEQIIGMLREANVGYLIELDRLRGQRRVWVLILVAHTGARLHDNILRYSDTIGRQLDYFAAPSRTINGLGWPASLYLYDFRTDNA